MKRKQTKEWLMENDRELLEFLQNKGINLDELKFVVYDFQGKYLQYLPNGEETTKKMMDWIGNLDHFLVQKILNNSEKCLTI